MRRAVLSPKYEKERDATHQQPQGISLLPLSQTGLLVHKPVRLVCVPECGISLQRVAGYAETQSDERMAYGET